MEFILVFYDHVIIIIIVILLIIFYILFFILINKLIDRNLVEGQIIEIIWTLIPIIFLIFLVIPSLKILYLTDELNNSLLTVKILGHQWYWRYEYIDFNSIIFDSFIIKDFNKSLFRLLDVDNRLVLPYNNQIRFLINSLDVIHSFAIPRIGVKVDAVPGRLNQVRVLINRLGIFYGQCSEICGVNHSFIPIVFEVVDFYKFIKWIKSN